MNDTPEPFVLQADAPPPPAPTPETDAVWADKTQNLLEHAKRLERLERQRDAVRKAMVHHSRPALEQAVALCEEQLGNISKGLSHHED
jgi:hypothetical protein